MFMFCFCYLTARIGKKKTPIQTTAKTTVSRFTLTVVFDFEQRRTRRRFYDDVYCFVRHEFCDRSRSSVNSNQFKILKTDYHDTAYSFYKKNRVYKYLILLVRFFFLNTVYRAISIETCCSTLLTELP